MLLLLLLVVQRISVLDLLSRLGFCESLRDVDPRILVLL
jgi:hypothetical protein